MKRAYLFLAVLLAALMFLANNACAYWVWTPETKKFINPKYAVKDSPKEQFEWGMSFYDAKNYQRAATEFEKLTKQYEYSEYAAKAQYYVGLAYENLHKYYQAFLAYQKAIENFPNIENIDEIVERQYNIGNFYLAKSSPKLFGTDILTSTDRAVEVYKKVVDNAPFGKFADKAQFNMGEALKKAERYDEALPAFQRLSEDYPNSMLAARAKYEAAYCAYRASLKPAYDAGPTDKAVQAFEDFTLTNQDSELAQQAKDTVQRLKDRGAEKSLLTAQFYERIKKYKGAIVYYKDILTRFPECSYIHTAQAKIDVLKKKEKR